MPHFDKHRIDRQFCQHEAEEARLTEAARIARNRGKDEPHQHQLQHKLKKSKSLNAH